MILLILLIFLAKLGSDCSTTRAVSSGNKKQKLNQNGNSFHSKVHKIEQLRVVNALNSLWVCYNAMNPDHKCVYCMCKQCYLTKSNDGINRNRSTRGRRNKMKSIDDGNIGNNFDNGCNAMNHHSHNLNQFVDKLYFSKTYKKKIDVNNADKTKNKKCVPFYCGECKCKLVDK